MKKLLLASVAAGTLLASGAANAADLTRVAPVIVAPPIFTWTGFYVGVNAGAAWNTNNNNNNHNFVWDRNQDKFVFGNGNFNNSNNNSGFTGGAQIGYNYQFGQFVVGLEADINGADLKGNRHHNNNVVVVDPNNHIYGFGGNNGVEWFGTVRARLGVAFDRALIYATGGFAYGGGGNNNNNFAVYRGVVYQANNNDNNRTGWTVGGGLEYAITDNITARVEGLYVDLGKSNNDNFFFVPVNDNRHHNKFGVVRAGVNYKFDWF